MWVKCKISSEVTMQVWFSHMQCANRSFVINKYEQFPRNLKLLILKFLLGNSIRTEWDIGYAASQVIFKIMLWLTYYKTLTLPCEPVCQHYDRTCATGLMKIRSLCTQGLSPSFSTEPEFMPLSYDQSQFHLKRLFSFLFVILLTL